jgi:hypothetical protein
MTLIVLMLLAAFCYWFAVRRRFTLHELIVLVIAAIVAFLLIAPAYPACL